MRATPYVSYKANPNTGFCVYTSGGWYAVGGNSDGAPQWAAIYALDKSATNQNFYTLYSISTQYKANFRDITSGRSGVNRAGTGYDLTTGLGSPIDYTFAPQQDFSLTADPSTLSAKTGVTTPKTSSVSVNSIAGWSSSVTLSPTSNPSGWDAVIGNPVSLGNPSSVTITVPSTARVGTYSVTLTGTDQASVSHQVSITITVT
jgi:subtilase family serine protease